MIMITFKSRKDREHMLKKAKEMKEYVDDYVECLEESMDEESMDYYERRGSTKMRTRYDKPHYRYEEYDDDPHYRMR